MKSIHTEIEINAPVEKVWSLLMNFESYSDWNPFIKSVEGDTSVGQKFKTFIQIPEGKGMTFKPTCLVKDENKEFRWLGNFILPGLFDGEHVFKMKPIEEGKKTKFVQSENFKGILLPIFWKSIHVNTLKGFEMMNRALKERAEKA